jgi:hypothetical protein
MRSMFVAQWFDGKDRDLVTRVGEGQAMGVTRGIAA